VAVSDELKDPWGWLVAGVSGGLGWAVLAAPLGPAAIAVGAGIGAVVLGSKVALGAMRSPSQPPRQRRDRLPEAPRQSPQGQFVLRARSAAQQIHVLADRPADAGLRAEIAQVDAEAGTVLEALRELAGRVTLVDGALQSANPGQVQQEAARLQALLTAEADPQIRAERQRALDAVTTQSESLARLARLRETLLARAQTAALDMEGLAARTGELVAMGTSAFEGDPAGQILADLTMSLESVRTGLAEAEEVSRGWRGE
jgi:hypothetical protein